LPYIKNPIPGVARAFVPRANIEINFDQGPQFKKIYLEHFWFLRRRKFFCDNDGMSKWSREASEGGCGKIETFALKKQQKKYYFSLKS
jgi:hypothetical protein